MGAALDNLNKIVLKEPSGWLDDAKARQSNKNWTKRSFKIAVRILREIRVQKPINGMTQKKLAALMDVSPQYINKVVKGNENLTLETIDKIEQVLGISLIEGFYAEALQTISVEQTGNALSKSLSISICEDICTYGKYEYSLATGTDG